MNTFQFGDFTLRSGARSWFKLECDAFTPADWDRIVARAVQILPGPFGHVSGVPRGGLPFADALFKFSTGDRSHPALVAEDVYTTGGSMIRHRHQLVKLDPLWGAGRVVWGVVFASRSRDVAPWVYPVLTVAESQTRPAPDKV